MPAQPWLTVVTVVRNDRSGLLATLGSVASQAPEAVEHVIVDGASTDGTRQLAFAAARRSSLVRVVSERDRGIYDAMNKGWRAARGSMIHFLNAGDVYSSAHELRAVRDQLAARPTQWLRSRVQFVDGAGTPSRPVARTAATAGGFWWGWQPVAHQGAFMSRSLLLALDGFVPQYRIAADYDLMRRALELGVTPVEWDRVTVAVDDGGVSVQHYVQGFRDIHQSRIAGRSATVRAVSAADVLLHVAVVASRRSARRGIERGLGVRRFRRLRRLPG